MFNTDRQGQGNRWTGAGTQRDRERDTETDRYTDTDIDNFNGQLPKKSV
jgi:hypothetical protein